ncbi:MAG: hypothetical protein K2K39_02320 [Clostridia bacterium]|nr:hypothetical protein [Clostridia bacterium]
MEIPDLFNEIYSHLVDYWQGKIEEADKLGFVKRENEVKEKLNEKLDEETKKIAKLYGITVKNRVEHTYYEICLHLFLFSFKAGMDMQKAFDEQP